MFQILIGEVLWLKDLYNFRINRACSKSKWCFQKTGFFITSYGGAAALQVTKAYRSFDYTGMDESYSYNLCKGYVIIPIVNLP